MAIYLGGDREDNNNYTSDNWKSLKADPNQDLIKITLPLEFDVDYYLEKREEFGKYSPDYWEWTKFKNYALSVFEFFRHVVAAFYNKYPIADSKNLLSFVDLKLKQKNLDSLADAVENSQAELLKQYSRSNRKIKAKINRYEPLKRLRKYAASAWIMFYALKQNLFVNEAIKFKNSYSKLDLNNDIDVLKAFRGATLIKYNLKKLVGNQFLTQTLKLPHDIYGDVDGISLFNNILKSVNGFGYNDYDLILNSVFEKVEVLKQKEAYSSLINIYKNYGYINNLIMQIAKLSNSFYSKTNTHYGLFIDEAGEDLVKHANIISALVSKVLKTQLDPLFVKDLTKIKTKLENVLDYSAQAYAETSV